MDGLILVQEFSDSDDDLVLQEQAENLPLQLPDGWTEGQKWKKSRQRIQAWLLLGQALEKRFGCTFSQLDIRRDEHGKPYSASHPEILFNLSHCDTACACIVGTVPAGIDVERKFRPKDSLVKRVCHPEEYRRLVQMEEESRVRQFRFLWSLKEAYVKMDGRGLGYGLDRVNLSSLLPIQVSAEGSFGCAFGQEEFLVREYGNFTLAACERSGGKG